MEKPTTPVDLIIKHGQMYDEQTLFPKSSFPKPKILSEEEVAK